MYSINGVEVFSVGNWNGDNYTESDLDSMVDAFDQTSAQFKPYLKLGHDKDQKLLQKDGLPSAGWISSVYRKGGKLLADFIDIPEKIYKLLEKKAYRKVSSEVFWNLKLGETTYPRLLSAVSLLGADMPAVSSLDDILNLYGLKLDSDELKTYSIDSIKTYSFDNGGHKMDEKEFEALKKKYTSITESEEKLKKENEELKEYRLNAEKEKLDAAIAKDIAESEKLVSDLELPKAAREYAMEILGEDKKEYSLGEDKLTKKELFKKYTEIIKATSDVNLEESSEDVRPVKTEKPDEVEEVKEYANKNNMSFSDAYVAYNREKAEEVETEEDETEEN